MASLVEIKNHRVHHIGTIPERLVGKVESKKDLKTALEEEARKKEAEAKAARRAAKKADGDISIPAELSSLGDEELAERYEAAMGRKPGNRTRETILEELAESQAGDE